MAEIGCSLSVDIIYFLLPTLFTPCAVLLEYSAIYVKDFDQHPFYLNKNNIFSVKVHPEASR